MKSAALRRHRQHSVNQSVTAVLRLRRKLASSSSYNSRSSTSYDTRTVKAQDVKIQTALFAVQSKNAYILSQACDNVYAFLDFIS